MALTTAVLEGMLAHFLTQRLPWFQDGRTWSMVSLGREVRYWMDYILGKDRRLFSNVSTWEPRKNSDHYMILGCIRTATLREHTKYLGRRTRLTLQPPTTPPMEDKHFVTLCWVIPKPRLVRLIKMHGSHRKCGYPSRVSMRQDPAHD